MKANQQGFTLIEMVAVVVILALLAASAIPRFVNVSTEARIASVNGVAGGIRSAASMTKVQWLVNAVVYSTTVLNGTTSITVYNGQTAATSDLGGFPTPATGGILAALEGSSIAGFTTGADTGTYYGFNAWPTGVVNSTTCYVNYQSGAATVITTGCT